jgi:phage tail-like protein
MSDDNVCLLVQRAGITKEFRLSGRTISFGYAPGGEHDLVLYDSLLDDVQGVLERQDGPQKDGFTPYWLRARGGGIVVENVPLPPRERGAIQLKLDQRIKVGQHYQLTVVRYTPAGGSLPGSADRALTHSAPTAAALPAALQEYLAVSRLYYPYLPEIYRAEETAGADAPYFLARFLALFESVFLPMQWTVQNYSLCLRPESAPPELLPWLADWYGVPAASDFLAEPQRRLLLSHLHDCLERKGTKAGLSDLLCLLLGWPPSIADEQEPDHFIVDCFHAGSQPKPAWWEAQRAGIVALIDWYKPAHTTFELI